MKTTLIILGLLSSIVLSLNINNITNVVTIHNASDFIELANTLNGNVTRFGGSTIVLDDDIDFAGYSDQFEPIGRNYYTLAAKFDGQGHTISNLHINSSSRITAIFGMTNGTSFKNLVVDASCSIHSTHVYVGTSYTAYVGGIIGYAYPDRKDANSIIENLVNMASVSFSGGIGPTSTSDLSYTFVIGGVIGYFIPKRADPTIRNCVNYGQVTHEGSVNISSLGGILGAFLDIEDTGNPSYITIKNCANYGNLVHAGKTTGMLGFGSIVTTAFNGVVERCINFGVYISNRYTQADGQIVGGGTEKLTIKDCIWTQNKNADVACGYSYSQNEVVVENSRLVTFNAKNLMDLNDWVESNANEDGSNNYSNWIALHLDGGSVGNASGVLLPVMIGSPIIDPTKEGHTFLHWCSDDDCTEGPATKEEILNESTTELYAMWSINNYTVTFIMSNGTFVDAMFMYNEAIVPPDMTGVEGFYGWNLTYERMPAFNLIIVPNNPPEKGSNVGIIVGSVIGGVAGIAIIILVILIVLRGILSSNRKKKEAETKGIRMSGKVYYRRAHRGDGRGGGEHRLRGGGRGGNRDYGVRSRGRGRGKGIADETTYSDTDSESSDLSNVSLDSLFPENYMAPNTLLDALIETGLDPEKAQVVADTCTSNAMDVADEGDLDEGVTRDDAAAIGLYTYDIGLDEIDFNPCTLISEAFIGMGEPEKVRGILCVLVRALRKLPVVRGKTLYRAVRDNVRRDVYKKGNVVIWSAPASTSPDMNATKKFLIDMTGDISDDESDITSSSGSETRTGTLFIISNGFGYNIQPYSLFPEEEEILLEPERRFQVESVIESDMTIVNLKMLDTPLSLPHIFGEESDINRREATL